MLSEMLFAMLKRFSYEKKVVIACHATFYNCYLGLSQGRSWFSAEIMWLTKGRQKKTAYRPAVGEKNTVPVIHTLCGGPGESQLPQRAEKGLYRLGCGCIPPNL